MTDHIYGEEALIFKEIANPQTNRSHVTLEEFTGFSAPDVDEELFSIANKTALDNIRSVILAAMHSANHRNDLETFHRLDEMYDTMELIANDIDAC